MTVKYPMYHAAKSALAMKPFSKQLAMVCMAALLLVGSMAAHAIPVARFKHVKPVVEYRRGSAASWTVAGERNALAYGDTIRTGAQGKADVMFSNGTLLAMRQNSTIQITEPKSAQDALVIRVLGAVSEVFVRPKGNTRVVTAAAIAAARGTEFLISQRGEDTTVATVVEGDIEFFNPQGRVVLAADQQSTAKVGSAPTPPMAVDASGLIAWTADITSLPVEFEMSKDIDPASPLGTAFTDIAQSKDADARTILNGMPNDATAKALLGLLDLHRGNTQAAIGELQAAVAQQPNLYQAHALLGLAYLINNQLGDAEASARRAVQLQPASAQAQGTLSMVLFFEGKTDEAARASERAVDLNPFSPFAHITQGRIYLAQQRLDEARNAYQRAQALAPNLPLVNTELGAVYLRLDQPQKAEKAYRSALALNPDSAEAHSGLGIALQRQGRLAEADAEQAAALKLAPGNATVVGNLAALYIETGKLEEAQKLLEQGKVAAPDRGSLYIRLSEVNLLRQDLRAAQQFARRAVELLPNSAVAHYQLGRVYLEQDRTVQAQEEFRQAVTLDRNFAEARYALGYAQQQSESGLRPGRPGAAVSAAAIGSAIGALNLQNLQGPGAAERLQAALLDPTVIRVASRSYGNTELDGAIGSDKTRQASLSHLQTSGNQRGIRGVTAGHDETDGPLPNGDSSVDRVGVVFGQKGANNPSGVLLLAQYQSFDEGLNKGNLSPLSAPGRDKIRQPSVVLGGNLQNSARQRTRALIQYIAPTERQVINSSLLGSPFTSTLSSDIDSVNFELRHDIAWSPRNDMSIGIGTGRLKNDNSSTFSGLPFPPIPPNAVNTRLNIRATEAYIRDTFTINRKTTLIGELKAIRNKATSNFQQTLPFPVAFDSTLNDKTNVLPTALLIHQISPRSGIRLRARRTVGRVTDFELLAPVDVFLFSYQDLPSLSLAGGKGTTYDLEYDYTLRNATFLRLGLFDQRLTNAREPTPDGSGALIPKAKVRGARLGLEGLFGADTGYFANINLTDAQNETAGRRVTQVPHFSGEVGLQYLNRNGIFVQPEYFYQGSALDTNDPTIRRGGYGVFNVRVGKRWGLKTVLYAGVNNINDKQYSAFSIVQPGRQYVLGASHRF